jgi:hypothetical protein
MTQREDFIWKHGVTRFGATSAVVSAVGVTWLKFGTLSSRPAMVYLLVFLVVGIPSISLVGGYFFERTLWRTFHDPDDAQGDRRTPPTDGPAA